MSVSSLSLVLCLSFCFFSFSRSAFPLFTCAGTHYECFRRLGSQFSKEIAYVLSQPVFNETLLPWHDAHPNEYKEFVAASMKVFPSYVSELRGIADGAGVSFDMIFLLNIEAEIFALAKPSGKHAPPHCTDIHVSIPSRHLEGHNEDGSSHYLGKMSFVNLTLFDDDDVTFASPSERFVAFSYTGKLPGIAFGWNRHFTFSGNALYPLRVRVGVPKTFIYRSTLASATMEEAIFKQVGGGQNRAYGQTIHIVSISDPAERYVVEDDPFEGGVLFLGENFGNYSHMNDYRILNVPFWYEPSSVHRLARANEFEAPRTIKDVLSILGDTKDQEYPLYRTGRGGDLCTLATCLFDHDKKTAAIYDENPKTSEPVMVLQLEL